jgi:uncharacterized membrane protein YqgA involved in biofilm formation
MNLRENIVEIIEIAAVAIMLIGMIGVIWNRMKLKRGIGKRTIQYITLILIIPTVLILTLEDKLHITSVATLFGTVIGYVLSDLARSKDEND